MKICGHPLHVMLVHFPAALLPIEFVAYTIFFLTGAEAFYVTSFHTLVAGVALGWLAAITGLVDFAKITSTNRVAINPALLHGGLNALVMTAYTVVLYNAWRAFPEPQDATFGWLLTRALANGLMFVGNFYGGELIFKHKIAVKE